MGLGIGVYYLWRHGLPTPARGRIRTTRAFAVAFVSRFRGELATEIVFLAFTPASWVAAPLAPLGRRIRRAIIGAASAPSR